MWSQIFLTSTPLKMSHLDHILKDSIINSDLKTKSEYYLISILYLAAIS